MQSARMLTFPTLMLLTIALTSLSAAPAPSIGELIYPTQPNEVLPIQSVLLYPTPREQRNEGRQMEKDNEIIYVKLLKRKGYRPAPKRTETKTSDESSESSMDLSAKDIFYVKALANGQFSHHRVKLYRLPEFYAISVFRKGELYGKF